MSMLEKLFKPKQKIITTSADRPGEARRMERIAGGWYQESEKENEDRIKKLSEFLGLPEAKDQSLEYLIDKFQKQQVAAYYDIAKKIWKGEKKDADEIQKILGLSMTKHEDIEKWERLQAMAQKIIDRKELDDLTDIPVPEEIKPEPKDVKPEEEEEIPMAPEWTEEDEKRKSI